MFGICKRLSSICTEVCSLLRALSTCVAHARSCVRVSVRPGGVHATVYETSLPNVFLESLPSGGTIMLCAKHVIVVVLKIAVHAALQRPQSSPSALHDNGSTALFIPKTSIFIQKHHPYTGNLNSETSGDGQYKRVSKLWRCNRKSRTPDLNGWVTRLA